MKFSLTSFLLATGLAGLLAPALNAAAVVNSNPVPAQDAPFRPRTWGDQGDGTFKNPVLNGDFSDPDMIRVGDDYYLITSTFQYSPGMAVMHSKDMVNWQYIGHCVPDVRHLGPELNWDRMNRYNRGVYAGSIRYHDGKFWMYYTTDDEGVFMTTAKNPAGPWEPSHLLLSVRKWDDNCPFWDDNGEAWMIASKPGKKWFLYLYKMAWDGRSFDLESETIIDNHYGSEGGKILGKINGYYYIFHNQIDGPGNRTAYFMRAKSMRGPWEKNKFLWGTGPNNESEPNQGGLVDTPDGQWWFMTHHGRGSYQGRHLSLLPVKWVDGWPVVDSKGPGVIVPQPTKPVQGFPPRLPQTSDDFGTAQIKPQWEWNYAPHNEKWSLTARPGWLRLEAWPALEPGNFYKAGNTLSQRLLGTDGGTIVVKADVSAMAGGQFGGVAAYWGKAGMLGVVQKNGVRTIQLRNDKAVSDGPVITGTDVWFQLRIDDRAGCTFAYSFDGRIFTPIGGRFAFGWANYRGTRFGLFTWNDEGEKGHIDFDGFHYEVGGFLGPITGIKQTVKGGPNILTNSGDYGGKNGAAETPAEAFDGDLATKYFISSEGGLNTGLIYTPENGPQVIDRFRFGTANDGEDRDPVTVTIEGSNDKKATHEGTRLFTTLYEGGSGLEKNPGRSAWGETVSFRNTTAYQSYRVLVTKTRSPKSGAVQYSEIVFLPKPDR